MPTIKLFVGTSHTFGKTDKEDLRIINIDEERPKTGIPEGIEFVTDDLKTLRTFVDGWADELIAIDTISRFPAIVVDKVLVQWKRTLKKGGSITLEQPDLIKCCINVLRRVTSPTDAQIHYTEGLKGLYGYWSPVSPHTEFHWCWDKDGLIQALANAGFVDIKELPVSPGNEQTHFKVTAKNG